MRALGRQYDIVQNPSGLNIALADCSGIGFMAVNGTSTAAILTVTASTAFTGGTTDNWTTKHALDSHVVGRPGSFLDIQTAHDEVGSIIFTLFWPEENRWLGRNYEVAVNEEPVPQGTAATKPKS